LNKDKYEVLRNRCDCHPETCCCRPWAVFQGKEKVETFHVKEVAENIAQLLNAAEGKE